MKVKYQKNNMVTLLKINRLYRQCKMQNDEILQNSFLKINTILKFFKKGNSRNIRHNCVSPSKNKNIMDISSQKEDLPRLVSTQPPPIIFDFHADQKK